MAEIYLNPESDVNWATDSEADVTPQADGDSRESVRAAGTLLKQLKASDMQSSKCKVCTAKLHMGGEGGELLQVDTFTHNKSGIATRIRADGQRPKGTGSRGCHETVPNQHPVQGGPCQQHQVHLSLNQVASKEQDRGVDSY
jgi:hypothetical protein